MNQKLIALNLFKTKSSSLANSINDQTELDYQEIAVNIFLKFLDILGGVIILVAALFLIRMVRAYLNSIQTTHERQRTAINLFEKITSGFIMVIAVTLALKVIGLDLTLVVSVLTLGLSFGLGDVVKNYVAGLLILFKSPFEIGDIVTIRTFTGKIEKIEFQAVTIRTFDQKQITIQNSDLLTQPIVNYSKTGLARIEITFELGYGSDIKRAFLIFDRILQGYPLTLKEPKYSILIKSLSHNCVNVLLRFWVQKPCNVIKIKSDITIMVQDAFDEDRLLVPYNREAGLEGPHGMTEARKERLRIFYSQPMLADIATQTSDQIAAAMPTLTTAPATVSFEDEEPE